MTAMYALLAGAILVVTLALVLTRPKDIGEAWWAVLGGGLTLVVGLVSFGQAWGILRETEDALLLLVGMMALSAVAEKAGFFEWAASLTARAGRGRVFLLYGFVFVVGTAGDDDALPGRHGHRVDPDRVRHGRAAAP